MKNLNDNIIDFLSSTMRYRLKHAGLKTEKLARAIGLKPKDDPHIVDATAGLGRDALVLAWLGFRVTMLERSETLYALLLDAMNRAREDKSLAATIERLSLIHVDAIDWLRSCTPETRPDVVYLDPMYPPRQKSARVKKEMIFLQNLLGQEDDYPALFAAALTCARYRVVVKRPRLGAYMDHTSPTFSITGRSSRFDIYSIIKDG